MPSFIFSNYLPIKTTSHYQFEISIVHFTPNAMKSPEKLLAFYDSISTIVLSLFLTVGGMFIPVGK